MTAASLFVVVAVGIQLRAGWLVLGSDLVGADDPAHFATGMMVYEYLRHAFSSNPIEFALAFYIRYPKVALGHWPPVYYALQAAWYAVTGPSIEWARVLSAGICCAIAAILFVRLRRLHGAITGALSAACFLVLPIIQASTWLVMSDLAVALFMLLAAITLAEFLDSGGPRLAAWFAVWSTLAILTKGSGWALGLFALMAPVIARRFCCFRSKWYWISGIAIVALSAPFYIWTRSVELGYPADVTYLASRAWAATHRLTLLAPFLQFLPPFVLIIALLGAASFWFRRPGTVEASALALVLAQCVFLFILPLTGEDRYFIPSAAVIMLLFGRGMTLFGGRIAPLALVAACFAFCGVSRPVRVDGYRAAVDSIPYWHQGTTILVGSDASGEGAFIAERIEHDRYFAGVVLRGSKVLASSGWSGDKYRLLFQSPTEVADYLQSVPVRYIVIDHAAVRKPHRELLEAAVLSAPQVFRLAGRFPISGARHGEVLVFENASAAGRTATIHMNIGSRSVEYKME